MTVETNHYRQIKKIQKITMKHWKYNYNDTQTFQGNQVSALNSLKGVVKPLSK